jgi:hypothetical protein
MSNYLCNGKKISNCLCSDKKCPTIFVMPKYNLQVRCTDLYLNKIWKSSQSMYISRVLINIINDTWHFRINVHIEIMVHLWLFSDWKRPLYVSMGFKYITIHLNCVNVSNGRFITVCDINITGTFTIGWIPSVTNGLWTEVSTQWSQ